MRQLYKTLAIAVLMISVPAIAQQTAVQSVWKVTQHSSKASFRGVHVVGDGSNVWASGSKGTILNSNDHGTTWNDVSPDGAEEFDFRDIHGFDGQHAVAMAVGSPARIYRTENAGRQWTLVYEDDRPEIFLDAMAFWDAENGIAFGDPIDGKVIVLLTEDGGRSWQELAKEKQPASLSGEGGFAASGTCLCLQEQNVFIGLGGARQAGDPLTARILKSADRGQTWQALDSTLASAAASGVFSIVFVDEQNGVAVGGTYDQPTDTSNHISITNDGGQTWTRPDSIPAGYRSCVFKVPNPDGEPVRLIAIGKTGADYSNDMGRSWKPIDTTGFYAADSCNLGKTVIAVGSDGRIGKLSVLELDLD